MTNSKSVLIVQIVGVVYFLLLLIISKSYFTYLLTQKISITLSLIACLYSLFAIFILIKGKIKFKWLFLIINLYIFLVHLYGIYFDIEMHN